jgi:predicted peroxiredoxin
MYVVTHDPKERLELVSSVFAQAVTSLSFGYETEIFLMDRALNTAVKGYIDGLKSESFASLTDLISMFKEMDGKLYVCAPFAQSHHIQKDHCIPEVDEFIDAGTLVVHAKDSTVFTY